MKKYFDFLEELRDSGRINMYMAVPHLLNKFPELFGDFKRAEEILAAWMDSFDTSCVPLANSRHDALSAHEARANGTVGADAGDAIEEMKQILKKLSVDTHFAGNRAKSNKFLPGAVHRSIASGIF